MPVDDEGMETSGGGPRKPVWVRSIAAAAVVAVSLGRSGLAFGQCGAPTSSCRNCHETEGQARPAVDEPWHADHAFGDFCADCHGGVRTASGVAEAHSSLADPLGSDRSPCAGCHQNSSALVERYKHAKSDRPPAIVPQSGPPEDRGLRAGGTTNSRSTVVLSALLLLFGAVGGLYVVGNERRLRAEAGVRVAPRADDASWSPYVTGALLGVVAAVSMVVYGHRLSGGGAYQQIAAPVGRLLSPTSVYWTRVVAGGAIWELSALAGAILGAFAASRASGAFRIRTMPDRQWSDVFGPSRVTRWIVGFIGAALTEFAAGIAGGCTASLAVSGGAALSPGAFVFMAGMFVGGIPAAALVYRRVAR